MPASPACPMVESGQSIVTRERELWSSAGIEQLQPRQQPSQLLLRSRHRSKPHLATLCVVPLPGINPYRGKRASFAEQALRGNSEVFQLGEPVMEALVTYKWRAFGRARFYIVYGVYLVNHVLFSLLLVLGGSSETTWLVCVLCVSSLLIVQECRQIWDNWTNYFRLFYNYVSLAGVLLPVVATVALLSGCEYPVKFPLLLCFVRLSNSS